MPVFISAPAPKKRFVFPEGDDEGKPLVIHSRNERLVRRVDPTPSLPPSSESVQFDNGVEHARRKRLVSRVRRQFRAVCFTCMETRKVRLHIFRKTPTRVVPLA